MARLGAIFAGGAARRFGGDKHAAAIGARAMIDHVVAALAPQCDALVVVGRDWPGVRRIDDLPAPGLGPLGALAGALDHAARHGFSEVLTSGCDLPDLPRDLAARLAPADAVARSQPLLGLWDSARAPGLLAHLTGQGDRSMRSWIAATHARIVALGYEPSNINTRDELSAYLSRHPRLGGEDITPLADRRSLP